MLALSEEGVDMAQNDWMIMLSFSTGYIAGIQLLDDVFGVRESRMKKKTLCDIFIDRSALFPRA